TPNRQFDTGRPHTWPSAQGPRLRVLGSDRVHGAPVTSPGEDLWPATAGQATRSGSAHSKQSPVQAPAASTSNPNPSSPAAASASPSATTLAAAGSVAGRRTS